LNAKKMNDKKIGVYLMVRCPKCKRTYAMGTAMDNQDMRCLHCDKKFKIKTKESKK